MNDKRKYEKPQAKDMNPEFATGAASCVAATGNFEGVVPACNNPGSGASTYCDPTGETAGLVCAGPGNTAGALCTPSGAGP